jgi:hypothetical protein
VVNSYPDEIQLIKVIWYIGASLRKGGDMVILSHAPDGQMFHQLRGQFGSDYGGRLYDPSRLSKKQEKAARIIVVGSDLSRSDKDYVGPQEKVIHCRDWAQALANLIGRHGSGTKVAVYPCATIQMAEKLA